MLKTPHLEVDPDAVERTARISRFGPDTVERLEPLRWSKYLSHVFSPVETRIPQAWPGMSRRQEMSHQNWLGEVNQAIHTRPRIRSLMVLSSTVTSMKGLLTERYTLILITVQRTFPVAPEGLVQILAT
jgi:hypothetical protein